MIRGGGAALLAVAWLTLLASPTFASVGGPCTVSASATSTGPIDVGTTDVWHIRTTDRISASGFATTPQTSGSGAASALGFDIPLVAGQSVGETSVDVDLPDASFLGILGRVFVLSGTSTGPAGGCTARLTVVLDDVNPLTTIVGAVGIGLGLIGLLSLARAVRKPERRVVSGVLGVGLLGAAIGILLQQTSTPGAGAPDLASRWAASVVSPAAVQLDAVTLAASAGFAALVALLMPFPSELFNRTLEANQARVRSGLGRIPLLGLLLRAGSRARAVDPLARPGTTARDVLIATLVVLVGGVLYGLLDPTFGPDARSLVTYAGIVAGLVVATWAVEAPRRSAQKRLNGDTGWLHAAPWTLLLAAACVAISRLAAFEPGYLYGLLIGFRFRASVVQPDAGRVAGTAAAWLTGLAAMAWFGLGSVRTDGIEPSVAAAIAESVFAALVVGCLEAVVVGLIPARFMLGEPLFRWSKVRWAMAYLPGVFLFCWLLLHPADAITGANPAPLATTVILFAGFGVASILFWAYFRLRPGPAVGEATAGT